MNRRPWAVAILAGVLSMSGVASAHQVGGSRFDAPIPLWLVFGGAGVTVAVTALWLGLTDDTPSETRTRRLPLTVSPAPAAGLRYVARALFPAGAAAAVVHGFFGVQVSAENFATVFVWAAWLKGVGLLALLAGSPWRVLSPWRTLYDGLVRLEGSEFALLGEYPERLGYWPAVLGFVVGVGILENLTVVPLSPRSTALVVVVYTIVMFIGTVLFGPAWLRRADPLAVLYRLFGRVAPIRFYRTDEGGYRVMLRAPWSGCTEPLRALGLAAFVIAAVYAVSFDGFTSTPEFQTLLFATRDTLGTGPETGVYLYVLGLAGFLGSFAGVSATMARLGSDGDGPAADTSGPTTDGGTRGSSPVPSSESEVEFEAGTDRGWRATALAFAPSILPIAAAYEVAHNYPFVVSGVGRLVGVVRSSLLSVAFEPVVLLDWLSLPIFWGSQALLIVVGHVVAVVAAHRVALAHYRTPSAALRGHLPLVALMVGYTMLSLWIVSRPIVGG